MLALGADDTAQGSHRNAQLTPNENACGRLGVTNKDRHQFQIRTDGRQVTDSGADSANQFVPSGSTVCSRPLTLEQNSVLFKGRLVLQQSGLPRQKQFGDPCGCPRYLRELGAVGDESGLEL